MRPLYNVLYFLVVYLLRKVLSRESLLVSHNNGVLLLDLENQTTSKVVSADQPVAAFDLHYAWKQVFWATSSTIFRTPLYDLDTVTVLALTGEVGSLAVDWVHNHVYWTDLVSCSIKCARVDGRDRRIVHQSEWNIGSMVLDPILGKLFWIEWYRGERNVTRVRTSSFDGSLVKTVYSNEFLSKDSPLSIDVTASSIYFYQAYGNVSELFEMSYEEAKPETKLFGRKGEVPKSLCLSKNGFYFSNNNGTLSAMWVQSSYTIVYGSRTDHFVSLEPYFRLLTQEIKASSQIRLMSGVVQPEWPDHCINHQCEHECVVISNYQNTSFNNKNIVTTACVCRYGYILREDGRSCAERGYLVYSSGMTFGRIKPNGEHNTLLFNDSSANIQTFDIDVDSGYIYWSDLPSEAIYRASLNQITRKETVVSNVTAYGLAIDWLHGHMYWSDQSSINVASVNGGSSTVLLEDLKFPGGMAVDPISRFIFWVQCDDSSSITRAHLDGSNATVLVVGQATCGVSFTADYDTSTLYWLEWGGTVSFCGYDGSNPTKLVSEDIRAIAILDHQPLWTPTEYSSEESVSPNSGSHFKNQLSVLAHDIQPSMVKVVKTSHQLRVPNVCADVECTGLCLPALSGTEPQCICPGRNKKASHCSSTTPLRTNDTRRNPFLTLVKVTPFSATMRCAGVLLAHPLRPWVNVKEIDSLVAREDRFRANMQVLVENKSLPFTIDGLNPATSYRLTVPSRVTRASFSIVVHTPPPPLSVQRLPLVTVPGIERQILWKKQGVHYFTANPWEPLVQREYFLLLISKNSYTQTESPSVKPDIMHLLESQIKDKYMVLEHYKTKEDFDDDPVMYLANIPWGEEFWLAMVQVTNYQGSYNLDIVYSERFSLPDPYWNTFMEEILEDQEHKNLINSIERI